MRMLDEAGIYLALDVNTPYVALTVKARKLSTPATTTSTSSLCSQPLICLLVTTTSFSSSLVTKLSTILTTPTLRPTSRPSPVTSSVTSTHRPTVRSLLDTLLPMSKIMSTLPLFTSLAVTMRWLALTSSPSTTIPGATRPPSPSLVGIKRWNFTATTACQSSCPSLGALRTQENGTRLLLCTAKR